MKTELAEFNKHFAIDSLITIGLDLADHRFFQGTASVKSIVDDCVELVLCSEPLPEKPAPDARVVLTNMEGWALCRCQGLLEEEILGQALRIRLTGPLNVQQRREFFRWDVMIPVLYSIPEQQQLSVVKHLWEVARVARSAGKQPVMMPVRGGFKVIRWRKGRNVNPIRINLSGSGLRFATGECLIPGTLVIMEIFLPLSPARVITAAGAVIRSTELQLQDGGTSSFLTAFNFEFIDERDREAIISYLFIEQRNMLRRKAEQRDEVVPTEPAE